MTQKEAIEKLALYLAKYHTTLDVPTFMYEASVTFLRMVNERACAMENAVSAAYLESATQDRVEDFRDNINQYALEATIALIEQLEE